MLQSKEIASQVVMIPFKKQCSIYTNVVHLPSRVKYNVQPSPNLCPRASTFHNLHNPYLQNNPDAYHLCAHDKHLYTIESKRSDLPSKYAICRVWQIYVWTIFPSKLNANKTQLYTVDARKDLSKRSISMISWFLQTTIHCVFSIILAVLMRSWIADDLTRHTAYATTL